MSGAVIARYMVLVIVFSVTIGAVVESGTGVVEHVLGDKSAAQVLPQPTPAPRVVVVPAQAQLPACPFVSSSSQSVQEQGAYGRSLGLCQ
jgi:hypothetical protein